MSVQSGWLKRHTGYGIKCRSTDLSYIPFKLVLHAGLPSLSFPVSGFNRLYIKCLFSRWSFLGKASKEGFEADREGPPMGLATGCEGTAGIGIVAEKPEEKALTMGTHKCVLVQLSETRLRCLHSNDAVSNDMLLHALHRMHLSGKLSGHPLYVCSYEHKCKAYSVHYMHMCTHISHSNARTLHGNESMQLPRRGKNIARHMSSPFDISSSRRVESIRPSVQTKLSMNGSKTSAPPQKKLAAHGDNLFSLEVFACPRKGGRAESMSRPPNV